MFLPVAFCIVTGKPSRTHSCVFVIRRDAFAAVECRENASGASRYKVKRLISLRHEADHKTENLRRQADFLRDATKNHPYICGAIAQPIATRLHAPGYKK